MMLARSWKEGRNRSLSFNEYSFIFKMRRVLERQCEESHNNMNALNTTELYTLKMIKMQIVCYVYFTIMKIKEGKKQTYLSVLVL